MKNLLSTTIPVVTASIITLLVYTTMPTYPIEPHGVVLPESSLEKPYNGDVKIYDGFNIPVFSRKIGMITVEYHTKTTTENDKEKIIAYAKKLAGFAGGDGIVFSIGASSAPTHSDMAMMILQGEIINTNQSNPI